MRRIVNHPLIISFLVVFFLIFLNLQGWLAFTKGAFLKLTEPWQNLSYQFSLKMDKYVNDIISVRRLREENQKLREEKSELLNKLTQSQEALRENEFLRKQLNIPLEEGKELILAYVIGQSPSNTGKYFLINKGEKDGIREGATVITAGNLLVGRIIQTTDSAAKVRLLTDSNSKINALIQESGITGLAEAEDSDLVINLLPQGEAVNQGEMVVTSGLAGIFPAGLLIGRIEELISSDVHISQKAKIKPAVNLQRLDKVFIIR